MQCRQAELKLSTGWLEWVLKGSGSASELQQMVLSWKVFSWPDALIHSSTHSVNATLSSYLTNFLHSALEAVWSELSRSGLLSPFLCHLCSALLCSNTEIPVTTGERRRRNEPKSLEFWNCVERINEFTNSSFWRTLNANLMIWSVLNLNAGVATISWFRS